MKEYKIICTHRNRAREIVGTLDELIRYFGYTLECGASWSYQKGCKKVNTHPKTIRSLLTALDNAVYNTQSGCFYPDRYELVDSWEA